MSLAIAVKRVYAAPTRGDGLRVLVDRLWPRGLTKEAAQVDLWSRALAPSNELRRWYGHEPEKWPEFKRRYHHELDARREVLDELLHAAGRRKITLLYGAKETRYNNAVALKEYIETRT